MLKQEGRSGRRRQRFSAPPRHAASRSESSGLSVLPCICLAWTSHPGSSITCLFWPPWICSPFGRFGRLSTSRYVCQSFRTRAARALFFMILVSNRSVIVLLVVLIRDLSTPVRAN